MVNLHFSLAVGAVFSLVIFTDPLTPPYEAAEWIRFACKVDSNASTFTYQWRGSCHVAGEVQFVINDPQLDKDGYAIVWVQSTPTFCLDYLECIATDKADDSTTTAGRLITNVTGVCACTFHFCYTLIVYLVHCHCLSLYRDRNEPFQP